MNIEFKEETWCIDNKGISAYYNVNVFVLLFNYMFGNNSFEE